MSVVMNVVDAYHAAADYYDDPANSCWAGISRRMPASIIVVANWPAALDRTAR